jgi:hypothetical protein
MKQAKTKYKVSICKIPFKNKLISIYYIKIWSKKQEDANGKTEFAGEIFGWNILCEKRSKIKEMFRCLCLKKHKNRDIMCATA